MFNRKVYIYKSLFEFFDNDETIITDFLKAFYSLYTDLIDNFDNNEFLLNDLCLNISSAENFIKNVNEEKVVIRIYDNDDIIELDDEILFFFGLEEYVNDFTKMTNFSYFVNVFLFLLVKKMNEKFAANSYIDFEKKWRDYVFNLDLDLDTKCFYTSNNIYICYIFRLYYLLF